MDQIPTRFAPPAEVTVAGPADESPVWWQETPQGRHALLIGDPDDGGTAYVGSLDELDQFVGRLQAALAQARA